MSSGNIIYTNWIVFKIQPYTVIYTSLTYSGMKKPSLNTNFNWTVRKHEYDEFTIYNHEKNNLGRSFNTFQNDNTTSKYSEFLSHRP